ncbi:uncharacterized protein EV420DRAFT_1485538 [Desarmillaria tabescens]|uniref:Uncharacterized protein n=1 Tax=Armillaria tabescens TaxID=1929756 RepID=A0AA39JFH5_ARMTA|nr:uncharacterized protein EV420DRAFT_1485538 [Desarmillaria tabescens]KAK0441802.1 hypothetical protein EV420DRAFT_1485538 [Desarmillaria tabescens]
MVLATAGRRYQIAKKENVGSGRHGGRRQRAGQGNVTLIIDHHDVYGSLSLSSRTIPPPKTKTTFHVASKFSNACGSPAAASFGRHTVKISVALIRARCPMTGISNVNYDKTSGTKKMAEIGKEYLIVGKNDIHFTLTAFNRETAEHDYHYSWSHHYLYESLECPFHAEFLIERQLHIVISEGDN